MKNIFTVLLAGVGAGFLIVMLKFGTIDPCGIVRAQVRQEAAREGGFGAVASALPDGVIDSIIAAQYGPLSPGRCIALAFEGAPLQAPTAPRVEPQASARVKPQANQQGGFIAPRSAAEARKQAGEEAKTAMMECRNKRLSGELKTYIASVECSNSRIVAALQRAGYRYMDLIHLFTAKRRALAEQVDKGILTEAQAELDAAQSIVRIDDEERQRDRGQR
jgi:hypothetical protein